MEILTRRVDTLAEQMEILTRRVDTLAEQMEILTRRVDALAEQVNTLVGQVVNLAMRIDALGQQLIQLIDWQRGEDGRRRGERYERDIVRRAVTIFAGGAGGTAEDFHVQEKLSKWIRAITGGERFLEPEDDPALSDLIWWKGEKVLVVEVSLRVDGYDVTRAHKRAQTLRSIGVDAAPVVIGVEWANDEAQEAAERKGVWWYVNEMPSEELIEFRLMEG
ncbi:MAG: hypothetical protein NZ781_12590, partial [Armatimonadetes bacterium]|nr:hypothetical protein [Armatimonadota bacterium]